MATIPRLLFVEAIAFFIASATHSGALIDVSVDSGANIAEGVIGAALVVGRAIQGGHFFPEQNPTETSAELRSFFLDGRTNKVPS